MAQQTTCAGRPEKKVQQKDLCYLLWASYNKGPKGGWFLAQKLEPDADREILLSGKNINELDLEVNGSHLGALGSDQRRARKVRITKEGLTVNK